MLFYFLLETEAGFSPSMRTISCACFWDIASTLSLASLNFAGKVQGVQLIAEVRGLPLYKTSKNAFTVENRIKKKRIYTDEYKIKISYLQTPTSSRPFHRLEPCSRRDEEYTR
jgi:hypothetical protein